MSRYIAMLISLGLLLTVNCSPADEQSLRAPDVTSEEITDTNEEMLTSPSRLSLTDEELRELAREKDFCVGGSTTLNPDVFILHNIGFKSSKVLYPRLGMGRPPFIARVDLLSGRFRTGGLATGELIEGKHKYWRIVS